MTFSEAPQRLRRGVRRVTVFWWAVLAFVVTACILWGWMFLSVSWWVNSTK